MTRQLKIFWTGMLIYAVSFFLYAESWPDAGPHSPSPTPGFFDALFSFFIPIEGIVRGTGIGPFHSKLLSASLLIVGWINPAFIVTAFLDLTGQYRNTVSVLRALVFAMIPFCWIFFFFTGLRPREGHYLWVLGILLALCSNWIAKVCDAPLWRR